MNSRDRLRGGDFRDQIERKLEELLANHPGLRALREKRRREEIQSKLEDSRPLKEILEDILKKSPALASLLVPGVKIKTPFDLRKVNEQEEEYVGKEFPTYFKILQKGIKQCPINTKFRIQYETDAANDYFERSSLRGEFELYIQEEEITDYILNLWNGLANLTVSLPEKVKVGDILNYKSVVNDQSQFRPFEHQFQVNVLEELKTSTEEIKEPREKGKAPSEKDGNDRLIPSGLSLPELHEIRKERWSEFSFNENSALKPQESGEGGYDFYINMDNICLLSEIKAKSYVDVKLLQERYKYALALIGLALLKEYANDKEKEVDQDILKDVEVITTKLSPIILPMISYLGELEIGS